jgi:hypothetical protein
MKSRPFTTGAGIPLAPTKDDNKTGRRAYAQPVKYFNERKGNQNKGEKVDP